MKIQPVQLTIKGRKQVFQEAAEIFARLKKGETVAPHHEISFENIETLRKILTEKRIELLHVIKQHQPDSLYKLAKLVNRDLKSVNTDLQILKELGLVSFEGIHDARKRIKPKVEYDKIEVEIVV